MRLAIDSRRWRLLRRLPRHSLLSGTELILLAVLAMQCARLVWAVVTPVSPLGEWRPVGGPDVTRARATLASGFDPFFRGGGSQGPAVVTSLQLQLFGVRVDEATGRGSAIIAGPDNVQMNYSVGEAIQPGVILAAVGFDNVVIERGGAKETLYLDQSGAAPVAAPSSSSTADSAMLSAPAGQTTAPGSVRLAEIQAGLSLSPRQSGNRITGLVPRGDPAFLSRLGLQPGDIVVQVSGRPIASAEDLQRAAIGLANGGNLSIAVERGAQVVPIAISISGQ